MPSGLPWDHPDSDPMADIAEAKRLLEQRPDPAKFIERLEVDRALSDEIRTVFKTTPALIQLWTIPIYVDESVPPGVLRVQYADGHHEDHEIRSTE